MEPVQGRADQRIAEINGAALEDWVVHDLRRLVSSRLHELGAPPHVVETSFGHVGHKGGVAGVYNKSRLRAECERALNRWADYVAALVTGETPAAKVIQLRA